MFLISLIRVLAQLVPLCSQSIFHSCKLFLPLYKPYQLSILSLLYLLEMRPSPSTVYCGTISISFSSSMESGDIRSKKESPVPRTQTMHDLVIQTLGQMVPSTKLLDSGQDFLQYNPLVESYACTPIHSQFCLIKLETYDGSLDPTQHMMLFTSQIYVYNASNSTCCRMFPNSLTRRAFGVVCSSATQEHLQF